MTPPALSPGERDALLALFGAGAALRIDEVQRRAAGEPIHDDLMSLLAHGLVAHTADGWGLTPLGRDLAATLAG